MITFLNEKDAEFGALSNIKYTNAVNGERSISGEVHSNPAVLQGIDKGWRLRFKDEYYCITFAKPVDQGNKFYVTFDAVHQFFWDFDKSSVHSSLKDGSHTFVAYLDFIFEDSGYRYTVDPLIQVKAFEKQSFGYKKRLTLFNEIITTTGLEFSVRGKVVRISEKVGTDLSTVVRKNFNLNDLTIEKNIGNFITCQKGFGAWNDKDDHSKGRLSVEYVSPLAQVYGRLEGEPITDERFSNPESLTETLKKNVEGSYTVSVKLDMEDLTKAGYKYKQPVAGDYLMAINETIGFKEKIRIVSFTSVYDVSGKLIDHSVTCNDIGSVKRQSANYNAISQNASNAVASSNQAIQIANRAMVSADGKSTVYFGSEYPEDNPKGTLTKGDTLYLQVGDKTKFYYWNGAEWLPNPVINEVEDFKQKVQEDLQAQSEESKRIVDERLRDIDLSNLGGFDEVIKRLSNVEKTSNVTAEMVGYDGLDRFNKNRADGQTTRKQVYGTENISLTHNGEGFVAGKTYTVSFNAECIPLTKKTVTFVVDKKFPLILRIKPVYKGIDQQDLTLAKGVLRGDMELWTTLYDVEVISNWYKSKTVRIDVAEMSEVSINLEYRERIDSNPEAKIISEWSENPEVIFDGGGL